MAHEVGELYNGGGQVVNHAYLQGGHVGRKHARRGGQFVILEAGGLS